MQIRIQHVDGREECVTLDASQTLRFGSRRSADVVLQGAGVFPIHFGILWHHEAFTAVPSQLARKIRVNGSRVRRAVLRDGDRIEVGDTVLTVLDTDVVTIRTETPPGDSRESSPPAHLRLVQSVWFARLLWACAVLPLVALIGVYVGQRPTADELFRSADAVFRQEDFARSMEGFGQFLHRHPRHALANEARMKRDLAQLLDRFDHGLNASLLVSEIKEVTGRWNDGEQRHPDAQHSLSQMLPDLVQDLARVAQAAAQRGAAQTASDARAAAADGLGLMYEYLPPAQQRSCHVDQLQAALCQLARDSEQTAALDATIQKIEQANQAGDLVAALGLRNELLREYPQLANNSRLWDALRSAARAQIGQVRTSPVPSRRGAPASGADAGQAGVLPVAPAVAGVSTVTPPATCVYAPCAGTVYGLDVATGRQLWQHPVGFECQETRPDVEGPPQLLVDTEQQQILRTDLNTGQVVWRVAFESPAAMPAADQSHAVAGSRSGRIVELALDNGEVLWQLQLPQSLGTAARLDPDGARCYQVADDSIVYVLSRASGACLSTHYLGHESGTVVLPPAVVGDYLLVLEQSGPASTGVHVLRRGDALQAVQTLDLPGMVVNQPAVLGALVYLPTDTGRVCILRYDAGDPRKPFSSAGEIGDLGGAGRSRCDAHVATAQGRLWIGSQGVRIYEPASAPDSPKLVQQIWSDLQVTQPLQANENVLIAAGRTSQLSGISVRAWDLAQAKILWSTTVGVPGAAPSPDAPSPRGTLTGHEPGEVKR